MPSTVAATVFAGKLKQRMTKARQQGATLSSAADRYTRPDQLFAAAASGDVGLLSLKWLLEWAASGRPLPRRQELPDGALLTAERLRAIHDSAPAHVRAAVLPVIAVSYCWMTPQLPDPDGEQLRLVASILGKQQTRHYHKYFEDMCERATPRPPHPLFASHHCVTVPFLREPAHRGVFWDWASIYQKDPALFHQTQSYEDSRSEAQTASFKRALEGTMDLWYAHKGTVVLCVTKLPEGCTVRPYASRGWTTYERCSAELIKPVEAYVVEEGKTFGEGAYLWPMCIDAARVDEAGAGRRPPAPPAVFAELLESCQFTNQADSSMVSQLYTKVATSVLRATTTLELDNMELQTGDGRRVAQALALCPAVEELSLVYTPLTTAEVGAIFAVALPTVRRLELGESQLGEAGGVALAEAIGKGAVPSLQALYVGENQLGEAGGVALTKSCEDMHVPLYGC